MSSAQSSSAPSQRRQLPVRANLRHLKNEAKQRLKAMRRERPETSLAETQFAVAKEYGFASWRALKAYVDAAQSQDAKKLFAAAGAGDSAAVRGILDKHPELVDVRDEEGATPLFSAAAHNRPEMVRLLLSRGADSAAKYGGAGHTPLSWALTVAAFDGAHALLRGGVKADLFCAAGLGELEAVKAFFDENGNANRDASQTGSSRFTKDGKPLPRPPVDPIDVASDALYIACRNGHAAVVRFLLSQKVNLSFGAYMSGTPLHWAHFNGSREIIEMLLGAGADPTARDDTFRCTPRAFGICVPANWGMMTLLKRRLREDPKLANILEGRGTPLHEAARSGQPGITRTLLKAGADPAIRDAEAKQPIDIARERNHLEVISVLEKAMPLKSSASTLGKKKMNQDWKPLMDAAFHGDVDRARKLLDAGADPNIVSKTAHRYRPLHRAIEHKKTMPKHEGHDAVVKLLLERGADPKMRGTMTPVTALQLAATNEPRFVKNLVGYFKPLDIFQAAAVGDAKRVQQLLTFDRSLAQARDEQGMTALHYCASSRMHQLGKEKTDSLLRIAKALLKAGADASATHLFNGKWPIPVLYGCCGRQDFPEMAETLMQAGANPCDGESVYHASEEGHRKCLALFEKYSKKKQLAEECSMCLRNHFHWGIMRGAKWLLEHGADPNSLHTEHGESALHAAAKMGANEETVALLLRYGADPRKKTTGGKTAIELAQKAKKTRVVKQLKEWKPTRR